MGVAAIVSVVACGGSNAGGAAPPPAAKQAMADVCAKACALHEKCTGKGDADACQSSCVANPKFRHADALRPEAIDAIGGCYTSLTCDELAKQPRDALGKRCFEEATRKVAASPKAATACSRFDAFTDRCGGDMAHCMDRLKMLKDAILEQYAACASDESSCKTAGRCIKEVTASFSD